MSGALVTIFILKSNFIGIIYKIIYLVGKFIYKCKGVENPEFVRSFVQSLSCIQNFVSPPVTAH